MGYPKRRKPIPEIQKVTPLPGYRLKIEFTSGSELLLNMEYKRVNVRYCPLSDPEIFQSVTTDGFNLIFGTKPRYEVNIRSDEAIRLALDLPPLMEMRLQNEREKQENTV